MSYFSCSSTWNPGGPGAGQQGGNEMSALVRITTGIMPQHSRVGMSRAMAQFGEVPLGQKDVLHGVFDVFG